MPWMALARVRPRVQRVVPALHLRLDRHQARRLRRAVPLIEERLRHHDQRLMLIEGSESFLEDLTRADWDNPDERTLQLKDLHQELEEEVN